MTMQADNGVVHPPAQGCLESLEAGRGRKDPSPWGFWKEHGLVHTSSLDIWPPQLGGNTFLSLKASSSWSFLTAAPGI